MTSFFDSSLLEVSHLCSSLLRSDMRVTTCDFLKSFNSSFGEVLEPGEVCRGLHVYSTRSMTLMSWAKALASNVFVGMAICQVGFLFLLRDLRSQHRRRWATRPRPVKKLSKSRKSWLSKIAPRALQNATRIEISCGILLPIMALFPILSLLVGVQTRFTGDLACGIGLALLFITPCILEMYAQRIRTGFFSQPDEEVQEESSQAPDARLSIPEVTLAIATAVPRNLGSSLRRRFT